MIHFYVDFKIRAYIAKLFYLTFVLIQFDISVDFSDFC